MVGILTQSMVSCFQSCRKQFDYRFNKELVPVDEDNTSLIIGSAVHCALEMWFRGGLKQDAVEMARNFPGINVDEQIKAACLVSKYIDKWRFGDEISIPSRIDKDFIVVDVEHEFKVNLVNPATKRKSRTWTLAGKVDGIVDINGSLYILEHKTTSRIDEAYIKRVSIDRQIMLYARAIEQEYKRPVIGAVYDILKKSGLRMSKGETEEEFQARYAELCAKNKSGKSTATRKMPETPEEFTARVYNDITDDNFVRHIIKFDYDEMNRHWSELWALSKDIKSGIIYRNTSYCNAPGRKPCPYLDLCVCGGDLSKCQDKYTNRRAFEELSESLIDED